MSLGRMVEIQSAASQPLTHLQILWVLSLRLVLASLIVLGHLREKTVDWNTVPSMPDAASWVI